MKKMETPAGYRPYPTAQEQKEERQRINAFLKEVRMTRGKFSMRRKEIMEATELTLAEKAEKILSISTSLIEDIINKSTEMRDWHEREAAAIKKHAGHGGFSYCPHDGEWSPDRPPAIKTLDDEWKRIFDQKVAETYRKAMNWKTTNRKAA